ncbi:hypothetical protein C8R44DRAFT_818117, partial [Mycena epipterygia]
MEAGCGYRKQRRLQMAVGRYLRQRRGVRAWGLRRWFMTGEARKYGPGRRCSR